MVLDGHDGIRACEFAQKHLPSVLLQSDIRDEHSLLTALKRAFYLTEREFFMGIDPYITRRMTLQLEIDVSTVYIYFLNTIFIHSITKYRYC